MRQPRHEGQQNAASYITQQGATCETQTQKRSITTLNGTKKQSSESQNGPQKGDTQLPSRTQRGTTESEDRIHNGSNDKNTFHCYPHQPAGKREMERRIPSSLDFTGSMMSVTKEKYDRLTQTVEMQAAKIKELTNRYFSIYRVPGGNDF